MPEYTYQCKDCGETFAKTMGIKEHETAKVDCPKCRSSNVRQVISRFNAITSKKS